MIIYIIGVIIIILLALGIFIFLKYTKLKDISNSLDMCMDSIDTVLEKKLKLVNSMLKDVKDDRIKEDFNYDEDATLYDRENILFDTAFAINKYVVNSKGKKLKEKVRELNEIEEGLDGLKDYYNSNVKKYNEIYKNKYLHKIFEFLKLDTYKSFKIKKLEEYEVFKN